MISARGDVGHSDLLKREQGEHGAAERHGGETQPAGARRAPCCGAAPGVGSGSRLGSRWARDVRLEIGRPGPHAHRRALAGTRRRRSRDRVLVGLHHLCGHPRPGEALDAEGGGPGHRAPGAPARRRGRAAPRPATGRRRAARARRRRRRAPRRDSRRCPRRPPACRPRTPRSAPCRSSRRRAMARTGRRCARARACLVSSSTLPSTRTSRMSSISGESSSSEGPITVSSVGMCSRSASNARSSSGRPLRSTAWPTNTIRSLSDWGRQRGERRAPRVDVHAVGDDSVVAAEEAPAGPGGRLGHGDPDVQAVEHAPRARACWRSRSRRGSRCRCGRSRRRGTGVRVGDAPGRKRRERLVDVDHVIAAGAKLLWRSPARSGVIEMFETALVGLQGEGPAERDEVVRRRHDLRPGPRCSTRRSGQADRTEPAPGRDGRSAMNCSASASICLVTPPGYVHEYGDRIATRIALHGRG